LLFEAASETLKVIAADLRHLGAEIGATMVLHTWGHPPLRLPRQWPSPRQARRHPQPAHRFSTVSGLGSRRCTEHT
jgi:hypothetical protein